MAGRGLSLVMPWHKVHYNEAIQTKEGREGFWISPKLCSLIFEWSLKSFLTWLMSNLDAPPTNSCGSSTSSEALFHSKLNGILSEKYRDWLSGGNSGSVQSWPWSRHSCRSDSKSCPYKRPLEIVGLPRGSSCPPEIKLTKGYIQK